MASANSIFVYLGAKDEGQALEDLVHKEAKRRGYLKANGDAAPSPFIVHCIRYTIEHDRSPKKDD